VRCGTQAGQLPAFSDRVQVSQILTRSQLQQLQKQWSFEPTPLEKAIGHQNDQNSRRQISGSSGAVVIEDFTSCYWGSYDFFQTREKAEDVLL
jgi:hypothetical protein